MFLPILLTVINNIFCTPSNYSSLYSIYQLMYLNSNLSKSPIYYVLKAVDKYLKDEMNITFLDSPEGKKFVEGNESNYNLFFDFFAISGKGISELGLESECYLYNKTTD